LSRQSSGLLKNHPALENYLTHLQARRAKARFVDVASFVLFVVTDFVRCGFAPVFNPFRSSSPRAP
jgi:hypothetical protein